MNEEILNKCADNNNYTIYTAFCKAQRIMMRSYSPVCSISGGSDSDIVLDLIHKVDEDGNALSGAKMSIMELGSTSAVDSWTTDSSSHIRKNCGHICPQRFPGREE